MRLFFDAEGPQYRPGEAWLEERPSVLVVHTGPGADHAPYKGHLGPALAATAHVVYHDLRGHGRSDRSDPSRWNIDTWVDDLLGLIAALDLERPVVVGAGWGTYIAQRFAARHPDALSRLVLANPNARRVTGRVVAAYDRLGGAEAGEAALRYYDRPNERTVADFLRICFPVLAPSPAVPQVIMRPLWNLELAVHWDATEGATVDLRPELAGIRVPTLVVAGEDDPQMPIAGVEEVVDALPDGVRFVRYPGARHSVFHDAPASLDEIRAFLAG